MKTEVHYILPAELDDIIDRAVSKMNHHRRLSVSELADRWNLTEQWVKKNKHEIGYIKIGNKILFPFEDVARYEKKNRYQPEKNLSNHTHLIA
jgi:hypothetical protein